MLKCMLTALAYGFYFQIVISKFYFLSHIHGLLLNGGLKIWLFVFLNILNWKYQRWITLCLHFFVIISVALKLFLAYEIRNNLRIIGLIDYSVFFQLWPLWLKYFSYSLLNYWQFNFLLIHILFKMCVCVKFVVYINLYMCQSQCVNLFVYKESII